MKNEIFEVTLVCDITTAQETLRIRYADANAMSSVRILLESDLECLAPISVNLGILIKF